MRNKKTIAIGILCCALILMGIGYSLFNATLNISGTAKASGSFDVEITDVSLNEKSSGATYVNTTTYSGTTATLVGTFNEPGDYITYDVEVSNLGSVDALITVEQASQNDISNYFKMSCNMRNRTELDAGDNTTFQCTIIYDENREVTASTIPQGEVSLQVQIQAVQKSTYQIPYVDQEDSCFISFIDGQINYYDTSKAGCGTTVEIPNNLRLKTSEVTNVTFNNQMCMAFAPGLNNSDNVTDEQFCTGIGQQISGMTNEQIFNSIYAAFVTPTFGEPSGEYHVVNTIGAGVFTAKNLTSISMASNENITAIKDAAFTQNGLQSVALPMNIQTIGDYAFIYNQLRGTLRIPASLVSIGDLAFDNASLGSSGNQISSLVFESGSHLQTIGDSAFVDNQISGTLTIPSSVTSIGDYAFEENQISTLSFAENGSLTTIGNYAFVNNQISGTFTIPSSVTSIGDYAFSGNLIGTLNLGSGLTSLGTYSFFNNFDSTTSQNTLTTINIDMTQSLWNSRGLPTSGWYDGTPTITYNQE